MLTNFAIPKSDFNLADVGTILWKNTKNDPEITVEISKNVFHGHDKSLQAALDESWKTLSKRAEASLPPSDKFKFYNSEILKWSDFDPESNTVSVEKGMFYKDITAVRSQQSVYDRIPTADRPSAFVLMNILITADDKIILGRRPYFGDWPHDRFECPGSFLKEKHIIDSTLFEVAAGRVHDDYTNATQLNPIPLLICDLPRVMETLLLFATYTEKNSAELESTFYTDLMTIENSATGLEQLRQLPLDEFHPPSRVALQLYFENFDLAEHLREN